MTPDDDLNKVKDKQSNSGSNPKQTGKASQKSQKRPKSKHNPNEHSLNNSTSRRGRYNKGRGSYERSSNRGQSTNTQIYSGADQADFEGSIQEEIFSGNYKLNGRKTKISINHLLDFQLPEIERERNGFSGNHNTKINRQKHSHQEYILLQGDSFINVNYKLLIDKNGTYSEQNIDPNKLVSSENIVRVVVPKGQSCPICLCDVPVAPRMVICGHYFCFTCLLTFFSIKEVIKNPDTGYEKPKKYKECPLCNSIIRPSNVKDVLYEDDIFSNNIEIPKPSDNIKIKLICRPHTSLLGLPVMMNIDPNIVGNFPPINFKEIFDYAKMIKCDDSAQLQFLQNDLNAIQDQLEVDKALFNINDEFTKEAIEAINAKIMNILSKEGLELSDDNHLEFKSLDISDVNISDKYNDSNAFYYYQYIVNSSSTKFFLSQLDIKILKAAFQEYSKFPVELDTKVENVHYGNVITKDFIAKNKYMHHLALGTEIAFIELDWRNSNIIPKEIFDKFSAELKQRRRRFNIKQKREDIQRKQYEYQLEKETAEFYKRENGELIEPYQVIEHRLNDKQAFNHSNMFADSLNEFTYSEDEEDEKKESKNPGGKNKSYNETTIWGTSIEVQMDEKTLQENKEFEEMLFNKIRGGEVTIESESTTPGNDVESNDIGADSGLVSSNRSTEEQSTDSLPKGKKSKKQKPKSKSKVLLFSNSYQTL
ncbi:hypothetical protein TPHA_0B00600 [Tetrapisispora phaffii CBS 4417]|uniref:RING-type domain-containing protein n=1 Tax=Tetrapisispora phaffii (strain ATCC 24235 / CBS 4417 / NBRC 1672 / NRRL Y-8282 / UCD 70-5) TaxID=1071381 RepID=G8BQD5_TETPH|nr:hypothetical protein TPHA_0B00600 [Tetrapisispora phaffii CBS 4417]CCE61732.1 hypothetical protein TPHA_0B00600 [Tetrapisispora phaffii CBS 4417]